MKLLVTGGAGYIGSAVTTLLLEAGHDVTVVDDLSNGRREAIPPGAEFILGRIHETAEEVLAGSGFDAVLHFAGYIEVAESVRRPDAYWENNLGGTQRLIEAMIRHDVGQLVFSSTGTVYGDTRVLPIDETAPLAPLNPYAASKTAVDLMLPGFCLAEGLAATSLRYFNASGALLRPGGHSCGERHDPESHLIPIVLQTAAGERPQLQLYGRDYDTPDGACVRDYIHVEDLARAHLLALETAVSGEHRIYNLGNGDGYSNLEVIEVAREVTGRKIPVVDAERRPGDIVAQVASSAKAAAELGWKPQRPDLRDIVSDAWEFKQALGS